MKMKSWILAVTVTLGACAGQPDAAPMEQPDTRAEDEATIHAMIEDWAASAAEKDAERFVSFYAEDGALLLEAAHDLIGMAALREGVSGLMQDPNFALSFVADEVEVARSSDFAFETGTYSLTMSDPEGNPAVQTGDYVVIWEKQADGVWKVVIDVPISDPPEEPAAD